MFYCAAVTVGSVITLLSNNLPPKNQPLVSQPVGGHPKHNFSAYLMSLSEGNVAKGRERERNGMSLMIHL